MTTGTFAVRRQALDDRVLEHAGGDQGVVPLHDPGDVLDRLARVESDLLAACVHGMPAELGDRHLHRVAGAVGGLLEDQCHALSGQWRTERGDGPAGELEHESQLVGREIDDVEQ